MKWLVLTCLFLGLASTPLVSDTTIQADKILVYVRYDASPNNVDVTVAVTALDNTPTEWAAATVYHVWYVGTDANHFTDEWPHMRAGHFRVQTMLDRIVGAGHDTRPYRLYAPPVYVEVK